MQMVVMDGNFTAEHLKIKKPEDNVWLADGHGFLVTESRYKKHLTVAKGQKKVGCHAPLSSQAKKYLEMLPFPVIGLS